MNLAGGVGLLVVCAPVAGGALVTMNGQVLWGTRRPACAAGCLQQLFCLGPRASRSHTTLPAKALCLWSVRFFLL